MITIDQHLIVCCYVHVLLCKERQETHRSLYALLYLCEPFRSRLLILDFAPADRQPSKNFTPVIRYAWPIIDHDGFQRFDGRF